jgi:hypothetical protein
MSEQEQEAPPKVGDQIELGGAMLAIERPTSQTLCHEAALLLSEQPLRAMGAAIALCFPRLQRKLKIDMRNDIVSLGVNTTDALLALRDDSGKPRVRMADIYRVGAVCIQVCVDEVSPAWGSDEVEAAKGN